MPPQRIVSLISSATEALFALGLGDRVVGVGHDCDFPPAARTRPCVTRCTLPPDATSAEIDRLVRQRSARGEPLFEIDERRLSALAPDVIITQSQCDVCTVPLHDVLTLVHREPALSRTRVMDFHPRSLGDVLEDIQQLGQELEVTPAARQLLERLQARIRHITRRTAVIEPRARPRVICLEWIEPLMIAANWVPELVEMAGGSSGLAERGRDSTYADWPQIVDYDPQTLVIMPCGFDAQRTRDEAAGLAELPGWFELAAVQSGRVFAVDANSYFTRSGLRLVDSLEILAHLLHPTLFSAPQLDGQAPAWEAVVRGL